jgi:hypothetical protein
MRGKDKESLYRRVYVRKGVFEFSVWFGERENSEEENY